MDEVKVVVGLRGAENVFFRGYKYAKRRSRGSQFVTWRCSHYKKYSCSGSIKTSLPPYSNPTLCEEHTHAPNGAELEVTEMRLETRKKAFDARVRPVDVLTTALHNTSDNAKAIVGKLSSLKRDLRRQRAKLLLPPPLPEEWKTTGDLLHKCQKCGRGFSKPEYLAKHQKTNCDSKTEVLECKPDLPIGDTTFEQNDSWNSQTAAASTSKSVPYHSTITATKDPLAAEHEIPETVIKEEVDVDEYDDTYSPAPSGDGDQMEYENGLNDQRLSEDPLSQKQYGRDGQFTNPANRQSFSTILEVADSLAHDIENILNDDLFKFGAVNPLQPRIHPKPSTKEEPTLTELKSKCALVELKLRMHYLKNLIQNEEEVSNLKKEAYKLQIKKEQLEIHNMREAHLQKMENLKLEQEFWKYQLTDKRK